MATVRFVSKAHADILRDYLGSDEGGAVVLVLPQAQKKVSALGIDDGDVVSYNFGAEPDLSVEMVSNDDAFFISEMQDEAD